MKVFSCTDHDAHFAVGCASIVIAESEQRAIELLDQALIERGLQPRAGYYYSIAEIDISAERALVLHDGNY